MPKKSLIPDHLREHEGWLSKKAGSFSKTPQRTVQLWTERGAIVPDVHETSGQGDRRRYSARNCVEIGIVKALSDMRVPFKQIKSAMRYLRDKGWLENYLSHDNGFLGIQINPDKIVRGAQYFILCFNDDELLESSDKEDWGRLTTAGSSDQTLIIDINRIAKRVIKAMM